jgi:hypothetical protein
MQLQKAMMHKVGGKRIQHQQELEPWSEIDPLSCQQRQPIRPQVSSGEKNLIAFAAQ